MSFTVGVHSVSLEYGTLCALNNIWKFFVKLRFFLFPFRLSICNYFCVHLYIFSTILSLSLCVSHRICCEILFVWTSSRFGLPWLSPSLSLSCSFIVYSLFRFCFFLCTPFLLDLFVVAQVRFDKCFAPLCHFSNNHLEAYHNWNLHLDLAFML